MSGKSYLKAAREAIGKSDWEEAKRQANLAIDAGGDARYNGYVFLGLALDKSGALIESQTAYFSAIAMSDENPLAIQVL